MCQGFSHFPGFLHHFVMAKLATSSIKVNDQSTPPELLSLCSTPLLPSPHHLIYPPMLHFLRLLTIMYLHLLSPLPPPSHPSNFLPPLFFPLLLRSPSPPSLHIPHLPLSLPLSHPFLALFLFSRCSHRWRFSCGGTCSLLPRTALSQRGTGRVCSPSSPQHRP